jgi:dTDP-4-dehydrorhamnose 3,5-epimerase-like enzyme
MNTDVRLPYIIDFQKNGASEIGYLAIAQSQINIPFSIKRIFWSYYTPDSIIRGRHAHYETEMILVAVAGRIVVNTEINGETPSIFVLDNPNQGLYIPRMCWHTMQYSHSSVQLVMASTQYDEDDYIRDYEKFKNEL